jgi:hypothetical protein
MRDWSSWKLSLIVITTQAVVRWHRALFRRTVAQQIKDRFIAVLGARD